MSDPAIIAEIGSRLKEYRLRKNLTQEEIAEHAGVGLSSVIKLESGKSISFKILVSILRALRLLEQFDAFVPEPPISPIALLKLKGKKKERASKKK